ncbi:MAG: glutamine--fructose-6-phosphate transaminase (isomerizing) [Bacteroidetes bacterium]|jgi:glucosamine--fructose-6-phosphate aminotransferase (isomerizing)|nr:glutamine--fructose-6-phosphate transaminase (isomerizing) [Bacteroidota bacterium]MCA6442157.1 glutamine--fructose-6-phosphate transaminase (isomerizing) [Bacteroidota bacterium]
MCGIVGYIGKREAYPILIKGLQRLEYRGYDSAGVAMIDSTNQLNVFKKKGKVAELVTFAKDQNTKGTIGIGHTRWATHGEPNDVNSHPHYSMSRNMVMIHNGIIENYSSIKENLKKRGHDFLSQTDTEVLVHLIEEIQQHEKCKLSVAVQIALKQVIGAYAIVVMDKNDPNVLVAAKKGSPMVIGVGNDEFFIASDASPIVEYTKNVVYLEDEQVASLRRGEDLKIRNLKDKEITPFIQELSLELESIEKGGYDHFMLKEIYEQPRSVLDSMRGRLNASNAEIKLGGIEDHRKKFEKAKRIIFVACGTSWHACLVGEYIFEEMGRIPVEVEYASEFRYRNPVIYEDDIVIAISQSGETADTLAAIELAKSKGATVFGICNVVGSSIARATHCGSYTHAGPEIGVASTKAFTAQITVITLMALELAKVRGTLPESRFRQLLYELESVPSKIEEVLKLNDLIRSIAFKYKDSSNALYLGRGVSFPVALEGALKLKEISYIHAEGYPAAEMKHGPIALIDEEMPVFVIATKGANYEKVVSNIQEVKARKGQIIAVVTEGDHEVKNMADHAIEIPETDELLVPLISVIPLQLLSYHIAVMRGCNVDQPRNLAKSVTVE